MIQTMVGAMFRYGFWSPRSPAMMVTMKTASATSFSAKASAGLASSRPISVVRRSTVNGGRALVFSRANSPTIRKDTTTVAAVPTR